MNGQEIKKISAFNAMLTSFYLPGVI